MNRRELLTIGGGGVAAALTSWPLFATPDVGRPRILGVAHMAVYVSDLAKARAFYKDFLGFGEPFSLKREDGTDRIAFIKINEQQYLELFAEAPPSAGRLNHIAVYTHNAVGMRDYLASRGVKTPEKVAKGKTGNLNFTIRDPDDHGVEFVEYQPDSWTAREAGKHMPTSRISDHIMHVGFVVGSLDRAMKFYNDTLGFQEFWRGSSNGRELSWVNMRLPDGQDYVEFMLYSKPLDEKELGVKNHVCLGVPDVQRAVTVLQARATANGYTRPVEMRVGVNRKRQANLFDPDGTRIELMEPDTIDGKPVPSSTAPAPR